MEDFNMKKCRLMKNIDKIQYSDAEKLMTILEEKLDSLSDQEPIYDGETHNMWEEKLDELQEIIDRIDESIYTEDELMFFDCLDELEDYQMTYAGLGNLSIELAA